MNKITDFIDRINSMKIYHLMVFMIFLSSLYAGFWYKLPITVVALANLIYHHKTLEKYSVLFYSLNFLGLAYSNYYIIANHLFLFGIFSFYLAYLVWFQDRKWNYPFYLLALVISMATLQKFFSLYFLNGNLIGGIMMSDTGLVLAGDYLDPLFADNSVAFSTNLADSLYHFKSYNIQSSEGMFAFAKAYTYIILLGEVALSLAFIFLKTKWKYVSLIMFLILTSLTRHEFGFFSILLTISLFDTDFNNIKLRRCFKLLLPIFLIGFCVTHYDKLQYFYATRI